MSISSSPFSYTLTPENYSSSSLSMIPASPHIFHGREIELSYMINTLLQDEPSRIAILGVGGIGKSTLALAALHSHDVVLKYSTRQYFISCDSATSLTMLTDVVGKYFGAEEGQKPIKAIIGYFRRHMGPSVLVLDNFETPWEPLDTRTKVEEFLSMLSDIKYLHIIVCSYLLLLKEFTYSMAAGYYAWG